MKSIKYVRFDEETDEQLADLAERRGQSIAAIVRIAVTQYLRRQQT